MYQYSTLFNVYPSSLKCGERYGVPRLRLPRTPVAPQAGAVGLTVCLPRPSGVRAREVAITWEDSWLCRCSAVGWALLSAACSS
jgi:hypothetical protein